MSQCSPVGIREAVNRSPPTHPPRSLHLPVAVTDGSLTGNL